MVVCELTGGTLFVIAIIVWLLSGSGCDEEEVAERVKEKINR